MGRESGREEIAFDKVNEVIKPKVLGGLGLENLALPNWALSAKWWWRSGEEKDAL